MMMIMNVSQADAVKRGCLRSSYEVGRSSGLTSRQRIVKSLREGLLNSGIGGGSVAWPICSKGRNERGDREGKRERVREGGRMSEKRERRK